jgi:hypothetical protein
MKTISIKTLATGIVVTAILFTSCKKGDTGPAGPAGTNGTVPVSSDGFIKGTVSGTRQDGTAYNESFNFVNYWGTPSATLDSTGSAAYNFSITRGVDIFGNNSANISVNTTSPASTTGHITLNRFSFSTSIGTNKQFDFSLNSGVSATITSLAYNTSSGLFTGTFAFTVNGGQNSTGNTASINGSFQATVTQLYYFKVHPSKSVTSNRKD